MAEEEYHLMYCCLACCGPFKPSRDSLRSNTLCSKALYYIEGQAVRNANEWNCTDDPILIAQRDRSHLFHKTNILPVLNEFYYFSLKGKWRGNDTNGLGVNHVLNSTVDQPPLAQNWNTVVSSGNSLRMVSWAAPRPIPQINKLHDAFVQCAVRRGNRVTYWPNIELKPAICQPCNQIMTQQSTTSHLLARSRIVPEPLVPSGAIEYYEVRRNQRGRFTITSTRQQTPTFQNNETRDFTYQACVAYAIHRCLPRVAPMQLTNVDERYKAHCVLSVFGFLLLEILSLMVESSYGTNGGSQPLVKPRYRYRGVIEVYISYMIWILLKNDTPEGEPVGVGLPACNLDFQTFHRYFFNTLLDAIVVAFPDYAHAMFITDVIFTKNWMVAGAMPFVPGMDMGDPADVLGYIAASIAEFYESIVRPYFSRHIAGLLPNPALAVPNTEGEYLRQITVYNMVIAVPDLITLLHVCERAANGVTDSFINLVGVHAVLGPWDNMLRAAPPRVTKLLEGLIDSITLQEYRNIMESLKVRDKSAEAIYLECFALDAPSDPRDQEELAALRDSPKCTAAKAAVRLIQCGAFKEEDDVEMR